MFYDINTVWSVIRNIEVYPQWRSDVFNVEILDSTRFIEYGMGLFPTAFLITKERNSSSENLISILRIFIVIGLECCMKQKMGLKWNSLKPYL